jgi:hypothetical protein
MASNVWPQNHYVTSSLIVPPSPKIISFQVLKIFSHPQKQTGAKAIAGKTENGTVCDVRRIQQFNK